MIQITESQLRDLLRDAINMGAVGMFNGKSQAFYDSYVDHLIKSLSHQQLTGDKKNYVKDGGIFPHPSGTESA